jgi:O-antigen/teichoic acid export membrane protein
MAANFGSRAVSMLVMVLTVSLTVPYLGAERFGVWMTVASLAAMLSFLDLGVGNAITNRVARSAAHPDGDGLRRAISGGLGFLFLIAVGFGIVLALLAWAVPWERVISTSGGQLEAEIKATIRVFVVLFSVALFSTGITRVFHGLQRGFEAHAAGIIGSLLSLLLLWLAASAEAAVPTLLASAMVGPILGNLALLLILARRRQFSVAHAVESIVPESRALFGAGSYFFILQVATMVGWGADSLIIAGTAGAAYVAIYNVCHRLFQFISQPLMVVNSALWPAYANAYNCGDSQFIRRTLKRSLAFSVLVWAAISGVLVYFGPRIISLWTDEVIVVSSGLMAVFSVWILCDVIGNAFAMFLNGCNLLRMQVISALSLLVVAVPMKVFLVDRYGLDAMLMGFAVLYLLNFALWFGVIFRRRIASALQGSQESRLG